jgi:predicted DNA-binding transcriptional regulator AlpA
MANTALGLSRAHGYALAQRGEYPARILKLGGRYRVVTASIIRLLSENGEEGPT